MQDLKIPLYNDSKATNQDISVTSDEMATLDSRSGNIKTDVMKKV